MIPTKNDIPMNSYKNPLSLTIFSLIHKKKTFLPFACIKQHTYQTTHEICKEKNHWALSLTCQNNNNKIIFLSNISFSLFVLSPRALSLSSSLQTYSTYTILCDRKNTHLSDRELHCKRSWIKVSLLVARITKKN